MVNGCLTGCALAISLLITIMFFFKKSVNNVETRIFKKMLICNIFESLTTVSIVVVALSCNNTFILKLLNRIDVMLIILWCSLMFLYIYSISVKNINKNIRNYAWGLNIIIFIFALFLNVTIINENGVLNSDGPLTYLGFIGATIYLFFMITTLFVFRKQREIEYNKYIPLFFLIFMLVIVAILRLAIPEINFISLVFSFVDMIMIFTIENPDIKLLKQVNFVNNQLEKSNRVKSEFLSSMSHEIRTPLNAVMGLSQLIDSAKTLEEAKENAKEIINSSNTLLNMITNILDISKVDTSSLELQEISYNLKELIYSVCDLFNYKISEKGLDFKIKIEKGIPDVLIGDVDKIKRIIANIIDNAVKYTDKGSIIINVSSKVSKKVCKLNIKITDSGMGISDNVRKDMFSRFNRDENLVNSNRSGMGLGLSITKSLVEYLGGTIEYETNIGKGTTFIITLVQKMEEQ